MVNLSPTTLLNLLVLVSFGILKLKCNSNKNGALITHLIEVLINHVFKILN